MDRTQACGACNVGSIPTDCTIFNKNLYFRGFYLLKKLTCSQLYVILLIIHGFLTI